MERLNHAFLSLQACLIETLKIFGDNVYKIPHLGKEKIERIGCLPESLMCPRAVHDVAKARLESADKIAMDLAFEGELWDARALDEITEMFDTVELDDETSQLLGNLCIDVIVVQDEEM
ncbi:Aste57867_495 [Aphanomyces stellatus]|nr:hypothetical protein As57867_000494 [Aphanomyces stellatus]VFT77720.1 Aste57867_495 [Aphanomyces stellatus]